MFNPAARIFFIYFAFYTTSEFSNVLCLDEKNVWHIIVSASLGYYDYPVEASSYQMYHRLLARGIPASNIILFSQDSVAFDEYNPYPGIIHHADVDTTVYSKNIYDGVSFDYAGSNCTVGNFLAVLSGNKSAITSGSGKVLNSGADSFLVIYYIGLNWYKTLLFYDDVLRTEKFVQILENMYDEGKYSKALLVIDSSRAGLYFDNYLKQDGHVMAITSSGTTGFAKSCFQDQKRRIYTAKCFSYLWLQFAEKEPHTPLKSLIPRLQSQYEKTKGKLETYGDYRVAEEALSDFYGPF